MNAIIGFIVVMGTMGLQQTTTDKWKLHFTYAAVQQYQVSVVAAVAAPRLKQSPRADGVRGGHHARVEVHQRGALPHGACTGCI